MIRHLLLVLLLLLVPGKEDVRAIFEKLERVHISESRREMNRVQRKTCVVIDNQKDFDALSAIIDSKVGEGYSDICLKIKPGRYYFREDHIKIAYGKDYSGVKIGIEGDGAYIIPAGSFLSSNSLFDYNSAVLQGLEDYRYWSRLKESRAPIEIVNPSSGLCMLYDTGLEDLSEKECAGAYVFITQCFKGRAYKLKEIRGSKAYFFCDDLTYVPAYKTYNVNMDCAYTSHFPRYKFCNNPHFSKSLPRVETPLYECRTTCFLCVYKAKIGKLSLKGLNFVGNRNEDYNYLIKIIDSDVVSADIRECSFKAMNGAVVGISNSPNVTVRSCLFEDCYRDCIYSDNGCSGIRVMNNRFDSVGLYQTTSSAVCCMGDNFLVSGNVISDFCNNAIRVGVQYNARRVGRSFGIVENNEVFYTDGFLKDLAVNSLMDEGAIYLSSFNDGTIVRYNEIHDYGGLWLANGIYCDAGASGYYVYCNKVYNITNGYCFYAPRAAVVEKESDSNMKMSSVNGVMMYNLFDGPYLFYGRKGENGCIKGSNTVFCEGDSVPDTEIGDVNVVEDDKIVRGGEIRSAKYPNKPACPFR